MPLSEKLASDSEFVLILSCSDRRGIVAAISTFLSDYGCNIVESAQFGDRSTGKFFLRIFFVSQQGAALLDLERGFSILAERYHMESFFYDASRKIRTLIMVSKFGHCLVDLLYRVRIGALAIEVPSIVSNHCDFEDMAVASAIPFLHLPITPQNKAVQEATLLKIIEERQIDLVVLARYMQILSQDVCRKLRGRIINIHHSFLPSFKGARPYHQAHTRGVKLIGATAHYVTADLDEGPIIEQAVQRVNHAMSPEDFAAVGRDLEAAVLARAVKWHAEHRIILNEHRTIIFSK